jgi:ABC-type dipeptide/oligopeptide/nickel transport systems, permease components
MNKTLLTGLFITALLLAAALFGSYFAPHGLDEQVKRQYIPSEQGVGRIISPPLAPGADYPFGTDKNGYDLMAKLLDGAKYTIFLSAGIALARVGIGGILGMLMGYYSKKTPKRVRTSSSWSVLNGIPIFLIAWFALTGITINTNLSPLYMSTLLGIVLTAVGVPSVVSVVKDKTMVLRERQFILASHSLGAGHWKIMRSHLVPHLKESLMILLVQEAILVLSLFGQLALFNIFVGGTTMYFDPPEYHSRTNEWGGLIGQARTSLYSHQWILFIPLACYILLIVGFHLVANGLEKLFKSRYVKASHF